MSVFEDFIKKDSEVISEITLYDKNKTFIFSNVEEVNDFAQKLVSHSHKNTFDEYLLGCLLQSIIYYVMALDNIYNTPNLQACLDVINENLKYFSVLTYDCFYSYMLKSFPEEHPARICFSELEILPVIEINIRFEQLRDILIEIIR